jgi:hypothetical protein
LAGDVYDAFAMVGKALGESSADVLFVDPFANESILEFAALAPENVTIRHFCGERPCIDRNLDPRRHRRGADDTVLTDQINDVSAAARC